MIKPLGEQIIIRLLPPDSVGLIIIPDSAKRITQQGTNDGPGSGSNELQYVNRWLFEDMTESMKRISAGTPISDEDMELLKDLVHRANRSILPKTATGIIPSNGAGVNFVEAEVIAVGPGKRKRDPGLLNDLAWALQLQKLDLLETRQYNSVLNRALHPELREPLIVKPGDRILYHPAVQAFDRRIDADVLGFSEGEFFIIREESVLAILDSETEAAAA